MESAPLVGVNVGAGHEVESAALVIVTLYD